jgi:hypothetical protein
MPPFTNLVRTLAHFITFAVMLFALTACSTNRGEVLTAPQPLIAPYNSPQGEVTWAIVPPRNESGTTTLDPLTVGDALVATCEEIRGVRTVPLNRTIAAMQDLKLGSISTPAQAQLLAETMGVDAVLVSTITAYDPYMPEMGLAVALYARPGAMYPTEVPTQQDPRLLSRQTTDDALIKSASFGNKPVSAVSNHLSGRNHQVQADVMTYAAGRQRGTSALGWKRYLASMPDFQLFVCYRTINLVLNQEWIRVGSGTKMTDKRTNNYQGSPQATNQILDRQVDTTKPMQAAAKADHASILDGNQ